MTSDFAPEVAKYPKSILPQQHFRECVSLLFRSVSDAVCYVYTVRRFTQGVDQQQHETLCGGTARAIFGEIGLRSVTCGITTAIRGYCDSRVAYALPPPYATRPAFAK